MQSHAADPPRGVLTSLLLRLSSSGSKISSAIAIDFSVLLTPPPAHYHEPVHPEPCLGELPRPAREEAGADQGERGCLACSSPPVRVARRARLTLSDRPVSPCAV